MLLILGEKSSGSPRLVMTHLGRPREARFSDNRTYLSKAILHAVICTCFESRNLVSSTSTWNFGKAFEFSVTFSIHILISRWPTSAAFELSVRLDHIMASMSPVHSDSTHHYAPCDLKDNLIIVASHLSQVSPKR